MIKKPERLIGFLTYDDLQFAFEFDNEKFYMNLYPQSTQIQEKYGSFIDFLKKQNNEEKRHEWISNIDVIGKSSSGYQVIFNVEENPIKYHGFLTLKVNWYCLSRSSGGDISYKGFKLIGSDINLFYPPNKNIENKIYFTDDEKKIDKSKIILNSIVPDVLGDYEMKNGTIARIEAWPEQNFNIKNWEKPVSAYSALRVCFSEEKNLDSILEMYELIKIFFQFITYRRNIDLGDINLCVKNQEGLYEYPALLVMKPIDNREVNEKKDKLIIKYDVLQDLVPSILFNLENNTIPLNHLVESIRDRSSYSDSRFIMILASFEKEFRNIYGTDYERSVEYKQIKEDIIEELEILRGTNTGKRRKYIKEFIRYIEKTDSSYKDRLKAALKNHKKIMAIFIKKFYQEDFEKAIGGISDRMGELRNNIAHNSLDVDYDAILLSDIQIVEILLYIMRLKNLGLSDELCKKAINNLFGLRLALD